MSLIMTKYQWNGWNTTPLVLHVMATVARVLDLDIDNGDVSNELYWICCDLEDFPEDEGFGSSDHYGYIQAAKKTFHIPAQAAA
jgi:hypothetical protein